MSQFWHGFLTASGLWAASTLLASAVGDIRLRRYQRRVARLTPGPVDPRAPTDVEIGLEGEVG